MVESVAVAIVGAGQAGFQVAASLRDHGHTGAIRIYEDFARRLRAEMDGRPAAETVALADGMRRK